MQNPVDLPIQMNKDVHIRLSLHLNYFEKESEKCVIVVASSSERFDERATLLSVYRGGESETESKAAGPQPRAAEQKNIENCPSQNIPK